MNQKMEPFPWIASEQEAPFWALPEGTVARLGQGRVAHMAVSPDTKYLVLGTNIGLWWYEIATLSPIALWDTECDKVTAVAFSPSGEWIATGHLGGVIKVWDVQSGGCFTQMQTERQGRLARTETWPKEIRHLIFSPDNQHLATTISLDYNVDVWHPETGIQSAQFGNAQMDTVTAQTMLGFSFHNHPVAFSPDSRLLAYAIPMERKGTTELGPNFEHEADIVVVADITRKEQVACLTQDGDFLSALAFSPCGNFLASGGIRGTLQVWNVDTWQIHKQKRDENGHQIQPAYTPEGVLQCVTLDNATITVWNIEQNEKVDTYNIRKKKWYAHVFTGTHFVMATAHDLNVWTLAPANLHTVPNTHTDCVKSMTFSADGKTLVSGYGYNHTLCWQVAAPSQPPTVFMPPGRKHRVYTTSTGKPYVTTLEENIINIWEFGNEIPIAQCKVKEPPLYQAIAFSPRTQLLAYAEVSGNVFLWDAACQELYSTFTEHTGSAAWLGFSPDGEYLASTWEQAVGFRLWDIERNAELQEFPGDDIETLSFSPCGNLVAGDTRKEIRLWHINDQNSYLVIPKPAEWRDDGYWQLALAFSPCGKYLAAGADKTLSMERTPVRLWNVATGTKIATFRGHFEAVESLAFSPDGTLLASGGQDGTILLWDIKPYLT